LVNSLLEAFPNAEAIVEDDAAPVTAQLEAAMDRIGRLTIASSDESSNVVRLEPRRQADKEPEPPPRPPARPVTRRRPKGRRR
jgi:hypothetical protein